MHEELLLLKLRQVSLFSIYSFLRLHAAAAAAATAGAGSFFCAGYDFMFYVLGPQRPISR